MAGRVLIVEDDARERADLAETVASFGYEVATATDGKDALQKLAAFPANAILTDLMMPRMDGFTLLKELQNRGDRTPAIVLTGFGSIDQAIGVVHDLKAFWFLEKPVTSSMMQGLLLRAIQQNDLVEETERLSRQLSYQGVLGDLVGEAPCMQEIFSVIRQVAPTTASVFISGESGTGKELVARAIHGLSRRSSGPFVAVNCAALPETLIEGELFGHEKGAYTGALERRAGCFEQAQNGTLFLDEIGEMPVGTQAKLLRVIEESRVRRLGGATDIPVSVRVLAATNRNPSKAIEDKQLREDLFYRLNVFHISLPPLRERAQDIPAIGAALIASLNKKHNCRVTSLSPEVTQRFMASSWPGNVRELRNIIERAVIVAGSGEIRLQHLPGAIMSQTPAAASAPAEAAAAPVPDDVLQLRPGMTMGEVEKAYLKLTLKHTNNNKRRAAQILGLCLRTLHNKLNSYNAEVEKNKVLSSAAAQGSNVD
jgi:DNA-binding NtrC family response regulator